MQEIVKRAKEQELELSQKVVSKILAITEEVVNDVVLAGDDVTILGVKHATRETKATTRVLTMGARAGEEIEVPAKIVPTVKVTPKRKTELTKEI